MAKIDIFVKNLTRNSGGMVRGAELHYRIMSGEMVIHENVVFGKADEHHAIYIIEDVPIDSLKLFYGSNADYVTLSANEVKESATRINKYVAAMAAPIYTPIPCEREEYQPH
ncbi:hypothetical protein NGK36_17065 [Hafnia alvei]|uniref:hypothetical protein n=1 Tax=Hafnia alvei TaxID=569 RepID=UPI002DBD2CA6|nr:hypothetical protein [Hafnia alvei]MEB7890983.1 hypothetical protein [Hafnia alvei]